jgi:phenylpyruvate tautomerase PptA (4-oxalocrotonate tautomerase family)
MKKSLCLCFLIILSLFVSISSKCNAEGKCEGTDFNPLQDPVIKITAPLPEGKDVGELLEKILKDFSEGSGVPEQMITALWVPLPERHLYSCGKLETDLQDGYLLMTELYIASFFTPEERIHLLETLADILSNHLGISKKYVFIHLHVAPSGHVYVQGKVQQWEGTENPFVEK